MKPMELKEATKCCGSPTLLWVKGKGYYMCPCGTTKVNMYGQPLRRFVVGRGSKFKNDGHRQTDNRRGPS